MVTLETPSSVWPQLKVFVVGNVMERVLYFVIFVLFTRYLCTSDECEWVIIEDGLRPLNYCYQNGAMMSCMMECNQDNDRIKEKCWIGSTHCDSNLEPTFISYPITSDFHFNTNMTITTIMGFTDPNCFEKSLLIFKTYLIDTCQSETQGTQETNAIINDDNIPFQETHLITNKCFNNTEYFQKIDCNHDEHIHSYSINLYSDSECNELIDVQIIENTNCKQITSCNDIDADSIKTTTYFTTTITDTEEDDKCNFINNIGHDIPINKCLTISSESNESQIYKCNDDGTMIEWLYFDNSTNCGINTTQNPKFSFPYPTHNIIDWSCNNYDCEDNEYMEIITISDHGYSSDLSLVDTCMQSATGNGEGIIYSCKRNMDTRSQHILMQTVSIK